MYEREILEALQNIGTELRGICNELERLNGGPVIPREPPLRDLFPPVDTRTVMEKKWEAGEME
jgi:hypothetical protein